MNSTSTHLIETLPHDAGTCNGAEFATYAHLVSELSQDRVTRAFEAETAALHHQASVNVSILPEGASMGRGFWGQAEWETGHLGFRCARLDRLDYPASASPSLPSALLANLKDEWRALGFGYVFTRIDTADHRTLHALEKSGFITVDNISLLFQRTQMIGGAALESPLVPISPAVEDDLFHLTRIAREAFRQDRFHNDPLIPDATADAMHADWIRNQVVNGLAEEVLVARIDGKPVGFVSMTVDRSAREQLGADVGTIVLVAVDGSVRGQGLGKAVTRAALEWFRQREVDFVQVGTQAWNEPAIRTYVSTGFRPARSFTTLRLHLP